MSVKLTKDCIVDGTACKEGEDVSRFPIHIQQKLMKRGLAAVETAPKPKAKPKPDVPADGA